jgi:hypothetical protein
MAWQYEAPPPPPPPAPAPPKKKAVRAAPAPEPIIEERIVTKEVPVRKEVTIEVICFFYNSTSDT